MRLLTEEERLFARTSSSLQSHADLIADGSVRCLRDDLTAADMVISSPPLQEKEHDVKEAGTDMPSFESTAVYQGQEKFEWREVFRGAY